MVGLGRYYELDLACRGEPDPVTGYLVNIKAIDAALRARVVPMIEDACASKPWIEPASLLPAMLDALESKEGQLRGDGAGWERARVVSLRWRLSPYYSVEMNAGQPNRITLRQQFDFAAAHRLHVESLGEARNRELFGRCNNPSFHGHNYRIEPAVEVTLTEGRSGFSLLDLERVTMGSLVERFDHKNLSLDCPEFTPPAGVNPSVENIAQVFYTILGPEIERASRGNAALRSITVWETDRTSCVYPG